MSNCECVIQNDGYFNKLSDKIQKDVNNIIKNEGFVECKVVAKHCNEAGASYMATLYTVDITGKTADDLKETHLFIKESFGEGKRGILDSKEAYMNELIMYKDISKQFEELEEETNVPANERFQIAKMYDESTTEVLYIENLSAKGYKMYPRYETPPLEYMLLAVKTLGRLHALSFALEMKRPEFYKTITDLKQKIVFDEDFYAVMQNMIEVSKEYLDENLQKRVAYFLPIAIEEVRKLLHNEVPRTKCYCHCDYKPNNILGREVNGQPADVMPIDFQTGYYGAAVLDIIYFIYMSTNKRDREQYLPALKDTYHESLTNCLKNLNIDVNDVYSREVFEKEFQASKIYGLFIGVLYLPFVLHPETDAPDFENEKPKDSKIIFNDFGKDRIRDIVEEFVEAGLV